MYTTLCIHSSVDGPLGCCCLLTIGHNAAMNMGVWAQVFASPSWSLLKACPISTESHVAFGAGAEGPLWGEDGVEWKSHTLRLGEEEVEAEKEHSAYR